MHTPSRRTRSWCSTMQSREQYPARHMIVLQVPLLLMPSRATAHHRTALRGALAPVASPAPQRTVHAERTVATPRVLHTRYALVHIPLVDTLAPRASPIASSPNDPADPHTT